MSEMEQLLQVGAGAIEALLRRAHRPLSLDESPGWLGLAEAAATNANAALLRHDVQTGLPWARCATSIYDALAADVAGWSSFGLSGMNVRVNAIQACGPASGDSVLDPKIVLAWARAALICSRDDALAAATEFGSALRAGDQPRLNVVRALRDTKNRLSMVARLPGMPDLDPELGAWLEIRDRLP